jgi:hypothetical protein
MEKKDDVCACCGKVLPKGPRWLFEEAERKRKEAEREEKDDVRKKAEA